VFSFFTFIQYDVFAECICFKERVCYFIRGLAYFGAITCDLLKFWLIYFVLDPFCICSFSLNIYAFLCMYLPLTKISTKCPKLDSRFSNENHLNIFPATKMSLKIIFHPPLAVEFLIKFIRWRNLTKI